MGKRDLKKQYKEFDFSLIDFISRFDTTKSKKLTPFLMRMFKKEIEADRHRIKKALIGGPTPSERIIQPKNMWENIMRNNITDIFFDGNGNVELLERFAIHLSENRIDDPDINNYNSWDDISKAVSKAEVRFLEKEMTKQIEVVYQDDTWLFLKPLSLKASQVYGMGTKWCTSMKHDPTYFYRYSREGILVYTINKKTGRKFGFYSSPNEFSVWDSVDRRVDSLETRIPTELLSIIRDSLDLDKNPVNFELFEEENKGPSLEKKGDFQFEAVNPIISEEMMEIAEETEETDFRIDGEMVQAFDGRPEPIDDEVDDEWTPRSADYAFNGGGMAIEMPQEAMEMEPMYVTENEVMDAPANTPLEIVGDSWDDDIDVAGVMDL
jgi:hypothetical protein